MRAEGGKEVGGWAGPADAAVMSETGRRRWPGPVLMACSLLAWPGASRGKGPPPPLTPSRPLFPRQPSPGPGLAHKIPRFHNRGWR